LDFVFGGGGSGSTDVGVADLHYGGLSRGDWKTRDHLTEVENAHFPPRATWSRIFQSCVFHPCILVPGFPVPRFQRPHSRYGGPVTMVDWSVLVSLSVHGNVM